MRRAVLACDPGKLSGFVVLDITNFETSEPEIVAADEFDQQTTAAHLHWWCANEPELDVVMEDFKITMQTAKKKDTRYSLELIGVGRYFATLYDKKFTLQSPVDAKGFVDNDRIRSLGLWVPGGEGHHKDAMRHAILYLVRERAWEPDGLLG